jgi:hypothetical protein
MKIETVRCDAHPELDMKFAIIRSTERFGSHSNAKFFLSAFCCSDLQCNHHYSYEYGYFPFESLHSVEFGDRSKKHICGLNHDPVCMVVTAIDGNFVWACPYVDCDEKRPMNDSQTSIRATVINED